jgi:hypothetical protein
MMSDSSIVVISSPPITVTSSPSINPITSSPIELYSSTSSSSYYSSSSSSAPDPFLKLNNLLRGGYFDSPPHIVCVPHRYRIMSDDDVSDVGAPLVNALEAHPSTDEVVDEILVNPYPGVSYGVPLDEISTAAEVSSVMVKTTDEVTDEGTLPPEPIQEIDLSDANLSLEDIAASLLDNDIKLELSKEEEELIADALVNTKRYESTKLGHVNRFFDTISQFGSAELKKLLVEVKVKKTKNKAFYFILQGEPTEEKRLILSKCLLLCALKWRVTTKKNFGKPLEPSTFAQYMKEIFVHFREHKIYFSHLSDLNGEGEYHAVLIKSWKQQMEKDDKFGTGIGTAQINYDADQKNRSAFADSKFNPFSTSDGKSAYLDRFRYLIFVLGRYVMLRGRKEVASLKWKQVKFCETHIENGVVEKYVEIVLDWDKGNPLKLTNTKARSLDKSAAAPLCIPTRSIRCFPISSSLSIVPCVFPSKKG